MAWRFTKRKKIAPGLTIGISKSGLSMRLGPRNVGLSLSRRGIHTGASIPGSGLSISQRLFSSGKRSVRDEGPSVYPHDDDGTLRPTRLPRDGGIRGTLIQVPLETNVRCESKFKTPLGSSVNHISVVADIDYWVSGDEVEIISARLSKCEWNAWATNTGEAFTISGISTPQSIVDAARADLYTPPHSLRQTILADAIASPRHLGTSHLAISQPKRVLNFVLSVILLAVGLLFGALTLVMLLSTLFSEGPKSLGLFVSVLCAALTGLCLRRSFVLFNQTN